MILMALELGGAALRRSDRLGEGASCEKIWSMMLMTMMTMIASSFPGVTALAFIGTLMMTE